MKRPDFLLLIPFLAGVCYCSGCMVTAEDLRVLEGELREQGAQSAERADELADLVGGVAATVEKREEAVKEATKDGFAPVTGIPLVDLVIGAGTVAGGVMAGMRKAKKDAVAEVNRERDLARAHRGEKV